MSSKCMICYQAQVSTVNTFDSKSVLDNYPIIFLLRKLLPVSSNICEDLLKENGHPSSWFSFCGSCLILVLKSQIIYSQLVHVQQDFESLQEEIKNKITQSFENGNNSSLQSNGGSTEKIRTFIAKSWGLSNAKGFPEEQSSYNAIKVEVEEHNSDDNNYDSSFSIMSDTDEQPVGVSGRSSRSLVKRELDEDWKEEKSPPKKYKRLYRQPKKLKCPQCDQYIVSDYMEVHIKKVHEGIEMAKPFSCSSASCPKTFKRLSDMQIHFRRKHSKETPYPCPHCNKKFTDLTKKHYHIKSFHVRGIERKFKKIIDVVDGEENTNNDEQPQSRKIVDVDSNAIPPEIEEKWKKNICHLCNKHYSQVQQHIRRVHAGLRPFKCATCPRDFVSRSDMERHTRRKHTKETPFSCNDCDKKFTDTTKLFYHYNRIHPDLKNPYRKRPYKKQPLNMIIVSSETITNPETVEVSEDNIIPGTNTTPTQIEITKVESTQIVQPPESSQLKSESENPTNLPEVVNPGPGEMSSSTATNVTS